MVTALSGDIRFFINKVMHVCTFALKEFLDRVKRSRNLTSPELGFWNIT